MQRALAYVPRPVMVLLAIGFILQITFSSLLPRPQPRAAALQPPPSGPALRMIEAFEPIPAAHLLSLYLQAFDNQPGISIPFRELDYDRVQQWLLTALRLDPHGQYPLLMASQLYGQVNDPPRQRSMLEFVYRHYFDDPERRWRWLAHAAIMAKHRLKDLPTALRFARAISEHSKSAPPWARQMHIFLLEDMGEYEAARILLGGLLAADGVTDQRERILLLQRLEDLKAAEKSSRATTN